MAQPSSRRAPAFYRKRSVSRRRQGRGLRILVLSLATGIFVYVILLGEHGLLPLRQERHEVEALRAEVDALARDRVQLEWQLRELEEPGGLMLEKVARENYLLCRPEERVVHVLGGEDEGLLPAPRRLQPGDPHH